MTYAYSETSLARLHTCHPDLVLIWTTLAKYVNCSVFCGHRTEEDQNSAHDAGLSQLRWPDSKHNAYPSMAIDSGPYFPELRNTNWDDYKAFAVFAGHVLLIARQLYNEGKIQHLVRWGGDWDMDGRTDDQTFDDLPHFELYRP